MLRCQHSILASSSSLLRTRTRSTINSTLNGLLSSTTVIRSFSSLRSKFIVENSWSKPNNIHKHWNSVSDDQQYSSIQKFNHSYPIHERTMEHTQKRNYSIHQPRESSDDPAQDFFDEMRRLYLQEEMHQNFYEFNSHKGRSEHRRRLLWMALAFPAVFTLLVACTIGFDKKFHEHVQGPINILVQQALSQYMQSIEQEKAKKGNTQKVKDVRGVETPLLKKGPILNEPNDNAFDEIEKDVRRYPILYAIIAANVATHFIFKQLRLSPAFARVYTRHMTCSVNNLLRRRIHTLITCTFVHSGLAHLSFNMLALYNMGHLLYESLSPEAFLAFYFGAGACASVGSILLKLVTKNYYQASVGASGAIFAVMFAGLNIISLEKAKINLIFLPDSFGGFNPQYFLPAYFIGEILFNIYSRRVKLDTGAHLTGAAFGYAALTALRKQEHHRQRRCAELSSRKTYYFGQVREMRKDGFGLLITPQFALVANFKDGSAVGVGTAFHKDQNGRWVGSNVMLDNVGKAQ
ncbi:hypothetical protein C9374_009436 [Naegleria lovaniensis]|uniref:Peptidase S54 rhomboid domain-containing protein n=1 Tax=Naegleria lovaniensis TaxID=51637 RepID=A0AA88KRP3_NAELO|nr:uncharacterized protein C9374_009436 [Naegleria lovaniensis]KAG2392859.1 hypothetical protein C9374_009436 [Naegleria lovaniensis]